MDRSTSECDVVVVGAGVAGAAAATVLARGDLRCVLVDRMRKVPPCFKAEKIEPDQAVLLRDVGLFDSVRPQLTPIPSVATAHRGAALEIAEIEQYGVDYHRLANALRDGLTSVRTETARAIAIDEHESHPRVHLAGGRTLQTRLVVLATGTSPTLAQSIGLERTLLRKGHSLAFGFDVRRAEDPDGALPFGRDFASITYYAERVASRYAYVTLFPIHDRLRANLFACLQPRDSGARALRADPAAEMRRTLPRLERFTGPLATASKVDAQFVDLYVTDGRARDGVVVIGDAFQSVDPATGTGLSKVFTDVKILAELAPRWLASPGMPAAKTKEFLEDARKRASDARSLEMASYRYSLATDASLRWHVHRARHFGSVALWNRFRGLVGASGR